MISVRNFKPAVHKPYTLKHTLFPSLRRQRRSEISQKSLEAVQSAVLNGIVITSAMLYVVPSAVFRIIPAVTPRFRNLRIFLFYDLHTFSSCQYRKSSSFCEVNTVRSGSPRSPKCLTVSPSRYIPVKKSTNWSAMSSGRCDRIHSLSGKLELFIFRSFAHWGRCMDVQ